MITDDQLAFFSNCLGSLIFVLIVLYHYLVANANPAPVTSHVPAKVTGAQKAKKA